ncbi:MAG: hypothetical protein O3A87_00380 [Verrucomicrobia bacterium]|nr:hypothetical protein [Verrucomicrobiota bacterium]MDA1004924.1 hypothetical protein [Verrucomicrobiota bacterium]
MKKTTDIFLLLLLFVCGAASAAEPAARPRILYVTCLPGTHHDYVKQRELFLETAKRANWEVTVMTGSYRSLTKTGEPTTKADKPVAKGDDAASVERYNRIMEEIAAQKPLLERLKEKDFAKGQDAIVYNFCLAHITDLEATANVIDQTRELGVPAFLIHCSMHSFWPTFRFKDQQKVLMTEWAKTHPERPFPNWGEFTGVASTGHGNNYPIKTARLVEHPATVGVADGYTTPPTELYNNAFITPGTVPLLEGVQSVKRRQADGTTKTIESKSVIMWVSPQGKSQVMGLTIGHGDDDFRSEGFQRLLIDGVHWMINP